MTPKILCRKLAKLNNPYSYSVIINWLISTHMSYTLRISEAYPMTWVSWPLQKISIKYLYFSNWFFAHILGVVLPSAKGNNSVRNWIFLLIVRQSVTTGLPQNVWDLFLFIWTSQWFLLATQSTSNWVILDNNEKATCPIPVRNNILPTG